MSAEKIYQAVTNRIDKHRKSKKLILKFIGGITSTAAVSNLSFIWWNLWRYSNGQKETKDKKGVLGEYNSIYSSSVGFPIMFMNPGTDKPNGSVSVHVTHGKLLRWNHYTKFMEELGQEGEFQCGEEIYWSPPRKASDIKKAVIETSLLIDGKKADTIKAKLIYEEPVYTMIKIEEEEEKS